MELLPNVHRVDGVVCNTYLLVGPEGLTLIDTGIPGGAQRRVLNYVRALGHEPQAIRRILLTHQHVDHVGNAAGLATATGAQVIASPGDALAIEGKAARELPRVAPLRLIFQLVLVPRLKPVAVTQRLRGGDSIPLGDGQALQVVETPGHTAGHISFYLPERKLLFAGDAYTHSGRNIAEPPAIFTLDMAQAHRSMRELARLEIEASLPGHGQPILSGAGATLREAVAALKS